MPRASITRLTAVLALTAMAGLTHAGPETVRTGLPDSAQATPLSELVPFEQPDLWIGDKAPDLAIAEFVKGDSVHAFEKDRTYVVEFWATWCGPCIRAFPHLSELQEEMADDVTFIGVNIWESSRRPNESHAARLERVRDFVDGQGGRMGYTVAVEQDEKMAELWMEAAGQDGIPAAFIVDGKGKIAWMGHPMGIDEPLKAIVAGEHEYEKTATELREGLQVMAGYRAFMTGIRSGDETQVKRAYKIADALAAGPGKSEAGLLNALAWTIIDDERVQDRDYDAAYRIAKLAGDASDWNEPMILDTIALAAFKAGDRDRAIELQEKAIGLLDADADTSEYVERLEMFRSDG